MWRAARGGDDSQVTLNQPASSARFICLTDVNQVYLVPKRAGVLGSGTEAREWGMGKRKDRIAWQAWGNTGREVVLF